jgi:hypothetical protein
MKLLMDLLGLRNANNGAPGQNANQQVIVAVGRDALDSGQTPAKGVKIIGSVANTTQLQSPATSLPGRADV